MSTRGQQRHKEFSDKFSGVSLNAHTPDFSMEPNFTLLFLEALMANQGRGILRTALGTEALSRIPAAIRKQVFFSAGVMEADWLEEWYQLVTDMLEAKTDRASARLAIKQQLDRSGYVPSPDLQGSLLDLSSDTRINLILDTQWDISTGWGQYEQSQQPGVVQAFPARELYRVIWPKGQMRPWAMKWMKAGGRTYGGRYIARIDDPLWQTSLAQGGFNRFGIPTGPFDFKSGMRTKPIGFTEAEQLGVIKPGDKLPMADASHHMPTPQVARSGMSAAMKAAVEKATKGTFDPDGVLRPVG